jgi:hypothetical protein
LKNRSALPSREGREGGGRNPSPVTRGAARAFRSLDNRSARPVYERVCEVSKQ